MQSLTCGSSLACNFGIGMRYVFLLLMAVVPLSATTLEKLSIEQMSQKATAIVRGRVDGCRASYRGSTIYTTCTVRVTERWKGANAASVEVSTPGGTAQGMSQSFSGSPALTSGQEYVLFLWTGRSGMTQLIGLSQGAFDLNLSAKGEPVAQRDPVQAALLDSSGRETHDDGVEIKVGELRRRVAAALGGTKQR
jgi:hypothetical protein